MEKNLVFFDKEGNSLNFNYNSDLERYEGDLIFHQNSSDTFKTQAIYLLEKRDSFDFELPYDLQLRRFQLFNEYGFHFYSSTYATQSILGIEPTNQESSYYSKWVYGQDFDSKFPFGTIVKFNQPIFEFTNTDSIYTVVGAKNDAILIISSLDNSAFTSLYSGSYSLTASYVDKTISSIDIIGIYNYITPALQETLSSWNESDFYDRIYEGRKLSIVNTSVNDDMTNIFDYDNCGLVTVLNPNIPDIIHYEYESTYTSLPSSSELIIEVKTKTDLPLVYQGPLTFTSDNRLLFGSVVSNILKPGVEFKVTNSTLNTGFLTVDSIPSFLGNVNLVYYDIGNQVIWNNNIFECIQAYTWSGTSSITPVDTSYWSPTSFLPISNSLTPEVLLVGDLYLTTDHFYFRQSFTSSSEVTFASAAQRYINELKFFNIDLYFDSPKLKADLIYPSDYVEVVFHKDLVSSTSSISSRVQRMERCINVEENLNKEFNYDISSNYSYNIVFTDIDEFGISIKINKDVYVQEIIWIYSSGVVDMQRTIDKTLRNWLSNHSLKLMSLGVLTSLSTIGYTSVYYNSIILRTEYPNIPLSFEVEVGDTADFYIEHSNVVFYDMSNYLSIKVNNRVYAESFDTDIQTTLSNWIESWAEIIEDYGIYVINIVNVLKFRVKSQIQRVDLDISVGKSSLPGIDLFRVDRKISGNHGALITSNEAILATQSSSFEGVGFATGMVVGVNETIYPLQNIEYNIVFLDPDRINFEYEGPFWGTTGSICYTSAYAMIALDSGFEDGGVCAPIFVPDEDAGMFDPLAFTVSFSIDYLTTSTYSLSVYALSTLSDGLDNMVDILYTQPVNSIYVLGDDIIVFNSTTANVLTTISLGVTNSITLDFNDYSNYLWALSRNVLFKIDPYINIVVASYSFTQSAYDLKSNTLNGDVYVSFMDASFIRVYGSTITDISTSASNLDMVFNTYESDMYVVSGDIEQVIRIDGSTLTIQATYSIPGLTYSNSIIYEPINESIYVFGSASLYKIDSGSVSVISVSASSFNDLVFNNITDGLNISRSTNHSLLDLSNDSLTYDISSYLYYGYQALNQYDEDIYMTSQNTTQVIVIDPATGFVMTTLPIGATATEIIYNPDRQTMWLIQPSTQNIIEISVSLNGVSVTSVVEQVSEGDNMFGTLDSEYTPRGYLWLNAKEYLRGPRDNFNGEPVVSLYWKWFSDNVPELFLYDFSGNQLPTSGALSYVGSKPLTTVHLNRSANRNPAYVKMPQYQQTIFDTIEFDLDYIDDDDDVSTVPEPIEAFIGFNSPNEGPVRSILQLYKKEDIDFTITTSNSNYDIVTFETVVTLTDRYGKITLDDNSSSLFLVDDGGNIRGLEPGQHLAIFINDVTNTKKKYLSNNNGYLVVIRSVYFREIIVDFFKDVDEFTSEETIVSDYPKVGSTTYLSTRFKIWDKEIGRFGIYGQTEVEDERYHIELNNVGKLIPSDQVFIFKDYDIKEEGIDWIYLNQKRKEMLMMKHLIYPYIGSYKSIINAINYFGYNDLELNEYYRNIDITSGNYGKLVKVQIPDIFDNSLPGWTDNDFVKHTFPNKIYEDTNLFNLTYKITDSEGNNLLTYTIEEVQNKLQGLKYWLQSNIIPITHRILDITGTADFVGQTTITHLSSDYKFLKVSQEMTPIKFRLNEAYLMPVNNGSTVYNCVLDFYLECDYNYPDYFTVDIRTYETYREWYPFKTYSVGERVIYYDKLYESLVDDNLTNNPRKYENAPSWQYGQIYSVSDIVLYDRNYYVYSGLGGTAATASLVIPPIDTNDWLDITDWKLIDLLPIQKISEYRIVSTSSLIYPATSSNWIWPEPIKEEIRLLPFNFTVDSNIDPFVVIEVSCDNGYGLSYRDRKNYDIKGILDIQELEAMYNLTSKQYRDSFIAKTDIKSI